MKFVSTSANVVNGEFKLDLDRSCKCRVALVEFNLPNINQQNCDENSVEIACSQIDSTFDNPHRILKTICFNRLRGESYYNQWSTQNFEFHEIDSQDKFLTFTIRRAIGGKGIKFHKSLTAENPTVFFTLAFQPIKDAHARWMAI